MLLVHGLVWLAAVESYAVAQKVHGHIVSHSLRNKEKNGWRGGVGFQQQQSCIRETTQPLKV